MGLDRDETYYEGFYSGEHYTGLFTEKGGSVFSRHRVVILSLGLLNAVLLLTAAVIGIFCKYECYS